MTTTLIKNNVHISYDRETKPYHVKIAQLVGHYTPEHGRVLDIGCGLGHILKAVHSLSPTLELNAGDCYEECLRQTQERVPSVNAVLMDEEKFDTQPFQGLYDTCIMSHSLEHMRQPLDVVEEVMSIIKPGGHFIVAVPNPVRPQIITRNITQNHYVNRGHIYAWDRSHWINFLENIANLHVVEYPTDEVRIFPQRLADKIAPFKQVEHGLAKLLPWFSFSNMAVICK